MSRIPNSIPRPVSTLLTDTSQTVLFTASANVSSTVPTDIHVANVTTASTTVTIEYSFSGGTDYKLCNAVPVQPNTTGLHLTDDDGLGFQLAPGGKIKVTAGAANALHITLSVVETPRMSG